MISLRIVLASLLLFALLAHVSAYWGGNGFFGHQPSRFRSSYYSPSYGYGTNTYSSYYGGRGFWGRGMSDDYLDDYYDRQYASPWNS